MKDTSAYSHAAPRLCAAALLAAALAFEGCAAEPAEKTVRFTWAFAHRDLENTQRFLDFGTEPVLAAGDRLQVHIELIENAYVYLFLQDAQKQLQQVFPPAPDFYDTAEPRGQVCVLPDTNHWFRLDEWRGVETFHLLASATRLTRLEELAKAFQAKPDDTERNARLLAEIRRLRQAHSDLASAAEKGVPIAGTVVTRGPNGTPRATLVEAKGFYGRTLRIQHE